MGKKEKSSDSYYLLLLANATFQVRVSAEYLLSDGGKNLNIQTSVDGRPFMETKPGQSLEGATAILTYFLAQSTSKTYPKVRN